MSKEVIIRLLSEFNYEKNDLEDTIEFLCYMTNELIKIKEKENE